MKTKLFLIAALLMAAGAIASAQITTGEPTSKVIKTGNRPGSGNYGIYLGATSTLFEGLNGNVDMKALPLINFKYMSTKQTELRIGLEIYKSSSMVKGGLLEGDESAGDYKMKNSNSSAMLYPGLAYHFSSKNILDVYVGAELPVGFKGNTEVALQDDFATSVTKRSFVLGLGAFIGLQAFVADLPLAIGAEFGISSLLDAGNKYKNRVVQGNTEQVYYTSDLAPGFTFDSLKARKGEIGSQLRLTVTYYFK